MRQPGDWLVGLVPDAEYFGLPDAEQRRFNLWLVYLLRGGKPPAVDIWVQLLKLNTEKNKTQNSGLTFCPHINKITTFLSPASVSCVFASHLDFGQSGASPAAPPWPSGRMPAFAAQTRRR